MGPEKHPARSIKAPDLDKQLQSFYVKIDMAFLKYYINYADIRKGRCSSVVLWLL